MGLERAKRYRRALACWELDNLKDSRLKNEKCKSCFYFDFSVSGQAFSERACRNANCVEVSLGHNTNVPEYCTACSKKYGICRDCGGDIQQRERRSLKPPR